MLTVVVICLRTIGLICCGNRAVALENLALRQQLAALKRSVTRPRLRGATDSSGCCSPPPGGTGAEPSSSSSPQQSCAGIASGLRRRWAARSSQSRPGRPSTEEALRTVIEKMSAANPLWGAPRIHGELRKLGIDVSERTVSRLLRRRPNQPSHTWRTFLANHMAALVAMDFFTVQTVTGRVLFVLVLLAHQRRRIVHFAITDHPTADWTAQQIIEAFPEDTAPRWLVRDRDTIYRDAFRRRVTAMAHRNRLCAIQSWQNPYAERLIGSLRRECLDHIIVLSAAHLRRMLARYALYYHRARTHLSLEKDAPRHARLVQPPTAGHVAAFPEVGGLHHRYERRAA